MKARNKNVVILLLFFRGKLPVRGRNEGPREIIWLFEAVELVNNSPKVHRADLA